MVTVCEAMVTLALLAEPVLRPMLKVTDPFPEPAEPDATSIQFTASVAVHVQSCPEVTLTDRCPPEASTATVVGVTP
jgi:hypothetical protein